MRARLLHHDSDSESECGTSDHSGMCLLIWLFGHHLLFFSAKMVSQANLFAKISLLPILIVDLNLSLTHHEIVYLEFITPRQCQS